MKRAGSVCSEPRAKVQKREDDRSEWPKNESNLPQFPPVVLQKIASMFHDRFDDLQLCDRLRFASVSRQMNAVVRSGIDRMERRRMDIRVGYQYEISIGNDDITVNAECIDALLAFGRPNHINCFFADLISSSSEDVPISERILASIRPSSIIELDLLVIIRGNDYGAHFHRVLTTIGEMANLKRLRIKCISFNFREAEPSSSPSLPTESPFLELLKLNQLQTLCVEGPSLSTPSRMADLLNRSPSNITNLCRPLYDYVAFKQLLTSMDDRVRANITSVCCLRLDYPRELSDMAQLLIERLPQCTKIIAECYKGICPKGTLNRRKVDEVGGRLLDSVITHGHRNLAVQINVWQRKFRSYRSAGGQTEFTYKRNATVVQVSLVFEQKICAVFASDY